jgi:hypothetical protein
MVAGIKVNKNWRKRYKKELLQLFGDFDVHSFVGISQLNWTCDATTIGSKRKVCQVFYSNPHGS